MRRKPLTVGFPDRDRDIRRKDAGKEGMQGAAMVGFVCALIALMLRTSIPVVMMRMLVAGMDRGSSREDLRVRHRRRHDARQLSENKCGHQQMDKTADCPQSLHRRPLETQFARIGVGSQCNSKPVNLAAHGFRARMSPAVHPLSHVRLGSKAEVTNLRDDFRFTFKADIEADFGNVG
jgi:hypothetical protein